MALSTLSELNLALLSHIRSSLTLAYPGLFVTSHQFVFSPADDEESDFRRLEEARKDLVSPDNQVVLPSVVLSFIDVDDVWRKYSGRQRWNTAGANSTVSGSKGAPITIIDKIKVYSKTYDEHLSIIELFILYLADINKITFTSQVIAGQQFSLQLEYEPAMNSRISGIQDKYNARGHIYVLSCQVKVTGVILLTSFDLYKRILKTSQTPFHIGVDGNTIYEYVPPDYHDSLNDTIVITDTIDQN